jgi:ataxia telangiectasia mutated family protein
MSQGRLLPSPELIPFRLTRDLVAGMGITGVEGPFRQCAIATMDVLRRHADAVAVVVDVFLHDPLYQWAMSPEQQRNRQVCRFASRPR